VASAQSVVMVAQAAAFCTETVHNLVHFHKERIFDDDHAQKGGT